MDRNRISHDILNILERLRIMHDLLKSKDFTQISKDEMKKDLIESMEELKNKFTEFSED